VWDAGHKVQAPVIRVDEHVRECSLRFLQQIVIAIERPRVRDLLERAVHIRRRRPIGSNDAQCSDSRIVSSKDLSGVEIEHVRESRVGIECG